MPRGCIDMHTREIRIPDGRNHITCTPRGTLRTPDGILDLVFNGWTQREHGAVEPLWLIIDVRDFPGWVWQVLQSESQLLGGLKRRMVAGARALGKAGRRTQWGGRIMHERLCQIDSGKQAAAGQPQRQ